MLVPTLEISSLRKITRHRELPLPGKVLVRQGQNVNSRNVIAEAVVRPEHILMDIARGLHVSAQQADGLMQRSSGDMINKDDLIAGPIGLTRRVVRAPKAGKVIVAGEGQMLMQVDNPPFQVLAGLPGTVSALIPNRGAVIETTGAIVQGLWGNEKMTFGLMQSKLQNPGDELSTNQLDLSLRGAILLGGHCCDAKVLKKAADIPLRGLILTSMTSDLIPLAKKMGYPIIVIEGFGRRSLNTISYNILTSNDNRDVAINANSQQPSKGIRPEIIIPLEGSSELIELSHDIEEFAPGQKIRITRDPYAAHTGTINSINQDITAFPSGLKLPAAIINLTIPEEQITVPLANLEVIV
jgi:hypothetical protein